jgi:Protein kinase domain
MNDTHSLHPSEDQLAALKVGKLMPPESVEVERHLAACDTCCEAMQTLPDDSLVKLLQKPDRTPRMEQAAGTGGSLNAHEAPTCTHTPGAAVMAPVVPAGLAEHPRYRILELLGSGGMGAVFKAEHLLMERVVALKVINRSLIEEPAAVERFRREVRAAAKLIHPNIVTAYDAEQAGESHFLVMEYVEGTSLAAVLRERGKLPVAEACNYARQAALGLQHAFERGMVHRDIKPHNLMLTPEGQIKILDFGLARFASETAPATALSMEAAGALPAAKSTPANALTQTGAVMGTPDYIAPEQARDAHQADIRADLYSLGCTFYDLLTGHAPFPGGSDVQKVLAHMEQKPRPIQELRSDVPPELARVLDKLLAKDPADRYQTPAELADALAPFLAPAPSPRRRRWPRLVAAGFLAAACLLAGAFIYVQTDKGQFVIETDDENVAVLVDKMGGVKIHDRTSDRAYRLAVGQHTLRPGDYQIDVSEVPAGVEFSTRVFTLKRGGKVVVTARLRARQDLRKEALSWFPADATFFGGRDFLSEFTFEQVLLGGQLLGRLGEASFQDKALRFVASVGRIDRISFAYAADPRDVKKSRVFIRLTGTLKHDKTVDFLRSEFAGDVVQSETGPHGESITLVSSSRRDVPAFALIGDTDMILASYIGRDLAHREVLRQALKVRAGEAANLADGSAAALQAIPANAVGLVMGEFPRELLGLLPHSEIIAPVLPHHLVGYMIKDKDEAAHFHLDAALRTPADARAFAGNIELARKLGLAFLRDAASRPKLRAANLLDRALASVKLNVQNDHVWAEAKMSNETMGAWMDLMRSVAVSTTSGTPAGTSARTAVLKKFSQADRPLTEDGVVPAEGGWRIEADKERTVPLFVVPAPGVDECLLVYRAKIKTQDARGRVYLKMWCHFPDGGEYFSKGFHHAVTGTTGWASYETPFRLEKNQSPDLVKLYVAIEGKGTVWIKDVEFLKRPLPEALAQPAADKLQPGPAGKFKLIKKIDSAANPITRDGVTRADGGWRIESAAARTTRLFEVNQPGVEQCLLTYRASMKSDLKGKAYLEMWCRFPDGGEYFSRGLLKPISGTSDWAVYETPFRLEKGQRPDLVKLNVVIEGKGTLWIKDIELLRAPLR